MKYYFPFHFKKSSMIALGIIVYLAYYLLLREDSISSISSLTSHSHHMTLKPHFLISALLPIYIATMIFGAAILGLYLGARIENLFGCLLIKNNHPVYQKSHSNRFENRR